MNIDLGETQLNRESKIPLYHQLYEILREAILGGRWPAGSLIPPESVLQQRYRVSQITVRQALDKLVNEGLIYRERGRGSFVAQPAIETSLSRITSFTEDMQRRGFTPGSRVFFSGLTAAPKGIAEALQVQPGEELAELHRLRFADGEPLSIEIARLVHRYCPGVLKEDFVSNSLRKTLHRQFGIDLVRAKQSIRAQPVTADQAKLLSINTGEPLLSIERVSFSQNNVPVEYLQIFYRADRYVFHTELQG